MYPSVKVVRTKSCGKAARTYTNKECDSVDPKTENVVRVRKLGQPPIYTTSKQPSYEDFAPFEFFD